MADQPPSFGPTGETPGAAQATKKCPSCAEDVLADAVICRFCRYDFRTGGFHPAPGQAPGQASPVAILAPRTNGLAIASLVLGIVWVYWIGSILALIFGYKAKGEIDRSNGMQTGRGMAIAGIVLGWIGIGGLVLLLIGLAVSSSTF
jgi:hypothetical protein